MLPSAFACGCLVTEPIEVAEPVDARPTIVRCASGEPVDAVLSPLDRDGPDPRKVLCFEVIDEPAGARNEWQRFLDRDDRPGADPGNGFVEFGPVTSPVEIVIEDEELGPAGSCHRIEVLVAEDFAAPGVPAMRDGRPAPSDRAFWWIGVVDDTVMSVPLENCR